MRSRSNSGAIRPYNSGDKDETHSDTAIPHLSIRSFSTGLLWRSTLLSLDIVWAPAFCFLFMRRGGPEFE